MADNIFTKFYDYINASLDKRIEDLSKSEEDLSKAVKEDGSITRKGLLFDPFSEQVFAGGGLFKPKSTYLSPTILKQVSRRDPFVAAIIDVRANQVASCAKKPVNRFDLGFKIAPKNNETEADADEVRKIEEYILNCGKTGNRTHDDKMAFDQFCYVVTRDMLVYGHCAIEKVRSVGQDLYAFLPLAAETIYYANKKVDAKMIQDYRDIWRNAIDEKKVSAKSIQDGEYEYVQVIGGKVVEGFAHDELIFGRYNLESDIDLNGYCYGPLERAISAITTHLQIENHQKQFFTHGVASRGVLVIQGDVPPNTLKALQAQWTQQTTGPQNAWRTPVLSGIQGVQWQPLTMSNRDMEFAAYQQHILLTICAAFGIDAEEIGFGHLSKEPGQRALSESSNSWKITASRDRGLRPILNRIESILNEDILPNAFGHKIAEKYHFQFVGMDAETEQEEIARLQAETNLHTTINEARKQVDKKPIEVGGELIMNPLLLQTLQTNMPKGMFMELFMGIQGASERPDLQYVPDPLWFQWQQIQMQMMQQQAMAQQGQEEAPPQEGGEEDQQQDQQGGEQSEQDAQAQQEMMQQQAQAQAQAIEQYIAMNPQLFKAMQHNLDLQKAEGSVRRIQDDHVEEMRDHLMKEFDRASKFLLKDVFQAIKDDMEDKDNKDE
jgi:hypothetical protein